MADNHGKCGILKKQINTYTRIKEPDDEPMSKIYIKKIALICIRVEESIKIIRRVVGQKALKSGGQLTTK